MGGKNSKGQESKSSLRQRDIRRVTLLLESTGNRDEITAEHLKTLWGSILVPELLEIYVNFLMPEKNVLQRNKFKLEDFASLYIGLVLGTTEEKAVAMANVIGVNKFGKNESSVSYKSVVKYVSALLSSYLKILSKHNDKNYKSWTLANSKMDNKTLLAVSTGWCVDLPARNDMVAVYELESWLSHTGIITTLHNYVLETMYEISSEQKSQVLPYGKFPSAKTTTILDISQMIYLNSFLPTEHKFIWRFLFSTETHGESFSSMLSSIINQGPTLLIVEDNEHHLFGGFASDSWQLGPKFIGSESSFLFTLAPNVNIFTSTGYNDHYMYVNTNQVSLPNGLGMGGQFGYWGIWLDSHFGEGECSESCTTFRNYVMPAASTSFHIHHLEVWGVGIPPETAAEKGERSVLDKDPITGHMLEMVGRKQYSAGLRDSPRLENAESKHPE